MSNLGDPSVPDLSPGGDIYVQPRLLKRPFSPRTSCIYLVEHGDDVLGLVLRERATLYDTYPIVALQNHPVLLHHLESLRLLAALDSEGIDWSLDVELLLRRAPFSAGITIPWQAVQQCDGLVEAILDAPTCGGVVVERRILQQGTTQRAWVDFGVQGQAAASVGTLQNVLSSVSTLWLVNQRMAARS